MKTIPTGIQKTIPTLLGAAQVAQKIVLYATGPKVSTTQQLHQELLWPSSITILYS